MHQITATSLCAVSVSTAVAAVSYSSQGYANIPIGILLSISAVAASKFGARLNHKLPGKTLSKLLGVAMLISVPFIFLKLCDEGAKVTICCVTSSYILIKNPP